MNRITLFALVAVLLIPCQAMALMQMNAETVSSSSVYFKIFEPTVEDCDDCPTRTDVIAAGIRWDLLLNNLAWIPMDRMAEASSPVGDVFTSQQIAAALNPDAQASLLLMGVRGSTSKYNGEIFTPGSFGRGSKAATKGLAMVWQQTMFK